MQKNYNKTKEYIQGEKDQEIANEFKTDLKVKKAELVAQTLLLTKTKEKWAKQKDCILTYIQFLELHFER